MSYRFALITVTWTVPISSFPVLIVLNIFLWLIMDLWFVSIKSMQKSGRKNASLVDLAESFKSRGMWLLVCTYMCNFQLGNLHYILICKCKKSMTLQFEPSICIKKWMWLCWVSLSDCLLFIYSFIYQVMNSWDQTNTLKQ
jgi:hypothetical protein